MRRKSGLSLIELTIGILMISGVALIYFQTMVSSSKKTKFYSEHFMAALLAGKVVENCLQETDINPYGIEALGLTDDKGKPFKFSTLITDGRTVFFQNPPIDEKHTPQLYKEVQKDFKLEIKTDNSKKGYFVLSTDFDWNASTGTGNFGYDCAFPDYVMKKEATSSYAFPEAGLEKKVVERILSEKDKSIGSLIPSPSAVEAALATGRIYFSLAGMLSSPTFKKLCEDAQKIKGENLSPTSDRYAQGTENYFKIARDSLDLLLYLKPHIEMVSKNIESTSSMKLYYKAQLENYIYKAGNSLDKIQQLFFACINEAASRYKRQIKVTNNLRAQRFFIERCFSMHRILYANRKFCKNVFLSGDAKNIIKSEYFDFIAVLESYFKKNDPGIFRLAQQEKKFARDETISKRYFVCKLTNELFSEIEELVKKLPEPISGSTVYKPEVIGQEKGDGTIEGAVTWARDQLSGGRQNGLNRNNGRTSKDIKAWNDWCLAFVNAAYGHKVKNLQAASAVESMYKFKANGMMRINKNPPAGAIMFTDKTPTNPYGHIFIATGKYAKNGDPIVISSGSAAGFDGIKELTLSEMLASVGKNYYRGWTLPE